MVSVIVPVFRAEKYLNVCVESIRNQTCKDIEIILVDDGSPDNSGSLCDAYVCEDRRIRVIHKENGGVSSARNAGIEAARGDEIVFVDSDDYVEPDYIEGLLYVKEKCPMAGHFWCGFRTVSGYQYQDAKQKFVSDQSILEFSRADIMTLHEMWLDASPYNKLFSKKMLLENNIRFDERLSLGEDWMFTLRYLDAAENPMICILTKPLYNYVQNSQNSLAHMYREDMLQICRTLNQCCEYYLKKWKASSDQFRIFYNSRFYSYENCLRNALINPKDTHRNILKNNNKLMRSAEFKDVYKKTSCKMHIMYRVAYRLGSFRIILITDYLAEKFRQIVRRNGS